jgi:adenylate kinase
MNIIIMGPQGSGKGTQAKKLADKFKLLHLEAGQILRKMAETDDRIKGMINNGEIVPDQETLGYLEDHISDSGWGFADIVFDGYPRSINQYKLLKQWIRSKGGEIDHFVYLDVSDDESINRLSSRRVCKKCGSVYNLITDPPPDTRLCRCGGKLIQREDDRPDIIRTRLATFHKSTKPVLDMADKEGILIEINGERPIEVVFDDIVSRIENAKSKNQS